MLNLTTDFLKNKIDIINGPELRESREQATDRYLYYNGQVKPIIKKWIKKEFKKPETVEELIARLVPINIVKKIIDKTAAVYTEPPLRMAGNDDEIDQNTIKEYEYGMNLNVRMKDVNAYYKLDKKVLLEMYLNSLGIPSCRVLPSYSYKVFSHNLNSPEIPDLIVKIVNPGEIDPTKQRYLFWTNDNFLITCGFGRVQLNEMMSYNNPDGINPYGTLPFVYMADSAISIEPICDDDLINTATAINVILTDLLFSNKYQNWSLIYTIGVNADLPCSPNSIIQLDPLPDGTMPSINQLKPEPNIDGSLRIIESLLSMLLSSRNLSVKTISNTITVDNIASGVSKAIDQSEVLEDRKKQHDAFMRFEGELWNKLAFNMMPVWNKSELILDQYRKEFSSDFFININLKEPQVMLSEGERIDIESKKIEKGFSTLEMSLKTLYPDMNDNQIQDLILDIQLEKVNKFAAFQGISEENVKEETIE